MSSRKDILEAIDGYKDTVSFLLALVNELTWDDTKKAPSSDAVHEHGMKQKRSGNDPDVTPDLAVKLGTAHGFVGDVKVSFATDVQKREKIRDQLLKYDEVLSVWKSEDTSVKPIANGSLILLTHHSRKVDATDYFQAESTAKRFLPANNFAIVSGVRSSQRHEFITLERAWGNIALIEKDEKLRKTVPIRLDRIFERFPGVRFYDASPPVAYLLETIWDCVLPSLVKEETFTNAMHTDSKNKARTNPQIKTTKEKVGELLREGYSLRAIDKKLPGAPPNELVKSSLDLMVDFGLGARTNEGYAFEYRKLRGGSLEFFIRKLTPTAKTKKGRSKKQLDLFSAPDERRLSKPVPSVSASKTVQADSN